MIALAMGSRSMARKWIEGDFEPSLKREIPMASNAEPNGSSSPGQRNPNKLANLRPGQGAEGRKNQVRSIANRLRGFLESPKGVDAEGRTRLQQIFESLYEIATDRKHPQAVAASQALLDRGYGKVVAEADLEPSESQRTQIVIMSRREYELVEKHVDSPPPQPIFDDEPDAPKTLEADPWAFQ